MITNGSNKWQGRDPRLLIVLVLTFGTGIVDAVSYFSLDHVFTANMSGNIALLGIGVATSIGDVAGNVFAFVGFVAGAVLGARLVRAWRAPTMQAVAGALTVELALLVVVTAIVAAVPMAEHDGWRYVVCAVLAAAMGVQTGIARLLAVQDVNTTVATMTLHDLAAASRLAGGDSVRWARRVIVVAALLFGAALGVALDGVVRWGGLAATAVIVAGVLAYARGLAAVERRAAI